MKSTLLRVSLCWGLPFVLLIPLAVIFKFGFSPWIAVFGIISIYLGYGFYIRASFKNMRPPLESEFLRLIVWYSLIGLLVIGLYAGYYCLFNLAHMTGVGDAGSVPLFRNYHLSLYFSFVTFTTLGFGEITPSNTAGRYIVVSEAFIGTLHMVSFIAIWLSRVKAPVAE